MRAPGNPIRRQQINPAPPPSTSPADQAAIDDLTAQVAEKAAQLDDALTRIAALEAVVQP